MTQIVRRRSKFAPPAWRVFEALVDETAAWWMPIEGESDPVVISARRPGDVVWSSPFVNRPHDRVEFRIAADGQGCILELEHVAEELLHEVEASALRHRWGEHVDRDLREWLDDGFRVEHYIVSRYRVDVADWTIVDRIAEGQLWRVDADVWAQLQFDSRWPNQGELQLGRGTTLWVLGLGRHRMSVRCIVEEPADFESRIASEEMRTSPTHEGYEILVPLAEFDRRLQLEP